MTGTYLISTFALLGALYAETKVEGPVVLFIGPPGSGKSTQAAAAARLMKIPVVSVEELIKTNASTFEKIRKKGITGMEPETDPVLNRLFGERLEKGDLSRGVILDGYPSTKDHGDYLTSLIKAGTLPFPLVIELKIADETVLERTKKDGQNLASVEQRLKDYHREMDMIELYFPAVDIVRVDGTKTIPKVEADIAAILKKRFNLAGGKRRP